MLFDFDPPPKNRPRLIRDHSMTHAYTSNFRRQNSRRDVSAIVAAWSRSRSMKIVDAGEATRTDAEARFT